MEVERLEDRVALSHLPVTIKQVYPAAGDQRWPAINNRDDIVYSVREGNRWQVYKNGTRITNDPNHSSMYPVISDNGVIVYFKDGGSGGNCNGFPNVPWQVIRRAADGTETQLEFSSCNQLSRAHRDAGKFAGIASDGTSISYYDFYNPNPPPTRRFNVPGVPQLPNLFPRDFPDINRNRDIVYSYLVQDQATFCTRGSWTSQW